MDNPPGSQDVLGPRATRGDPQNPATLSASVSVVLLLLLLTFLPTGVWAQDALQHDQGTRSVLAVGGDSVPELGDPPHVHSVSIHDRSPRVPVRPSEESREEAPALRDDDDDFLHVGGAVRFNFLSEFYESERDPNNTQFTWDTWRINVQARTSGVGVQFEYRFYPTFNTHFIKEGWLEYDVSEETQLQVGVTQNPFGNVQYNSHNWWFQLPYYVGLEDDHDMGFKVSQHREDGWNLDLAYYLQPEPSGPAYGQASFGVGGAGRYSYDMIPTDGQSNQERHQGNLRLTRTLEHEGGGSIEVGGSLQAGGIYNSVQDDWGSRWAWAAHADGTYGPWNVKAQFLQYGYDAIDDEGVDTDVIRKGAYGDPYDVAAEAWIATLGAQYTMEIDWGPLSQISFYDNYSYMQKAVDGFHPTHQNVLGFSIAAGGLFTYFDLATGRNHPWLTEDFGAGLGEGLPDAPWNHRFNINIGYYF